MSIAASLKATGIAEVIIVLKPNFGIQIAEAAVSGPPEIARHCKYSPCSQDGALMEALVSRNNTFTSLAAAGDTSASSISAMSAPSSASRFYPNLGLMLGTVDRLGLAGLRKEPGVQQIFQATPLRLVKPVSAAVPTAHVGYTWGLRELRVDQLHAKGLSGEGVLVGHLDTGVDGSHPALAGVVKVFAEFDRFGNKVEGAKAWDSAQHGTHTAGTIAGQSIKGVAFGVAPGAKLASAMVIEGGNTLARILGGMDWAIGQKVRVLSMSLGFIGYDDTYLALTQTLRASGVLPVFAVGNEGAGTSRSPGNYSEAMSVGAMNSDGAIPDFSGSQRFLRKDDPIVPDLVGPGVDVISCVPGENYLQMSGSSMATPHIAGLVALLMEAKPKKTIYEVEDAILKSCALRQGMLTSRANRGFPDGIMALSLL